MGRFKSVFDAIAATPDEAADLRFRSDLMLMLRDKFESEGLDQKQIAALLSEPQPRVSELMTGKLSKFSSDKLIRYAQKAGVEFKPRFIPKTATRAARVECEVECVA